MKTIDKTKLEAVIKTLGAMKPSYVTYSEAAQALIENTTIAFMLDGKHKANLRMVTASALEEIVRRQSEKLDLYAESVRGGESAELNWHVADRLGISEDMIDVVVTMILAGDHFDLVANCLLLGDYITDSECRKNIKDLNIFAYAHKFR